MIRNSDRKPTSSGIRYSRIDGPGVRTPSTRRATAAFAVASASSAERVRPVWCMAASSQSSPPATRAASRSRLTSPSISSTRAMPIVAAPSLRCS